MNEFHDATWAFVLFDARNCLESYVDSTSGLILWLSVCMRYDQRGGIV